MRDPFVYIEPFPSDAVDQLPPNTLAMMTLHHDRDSERYLLVCKHGTTGLEARTGTAEDIEEVWSMVRGAHVRHWDCPCRRPVELIDEWPSLAMAQEQFSDDAQTPPPADSEYFNYQAQMRENARRLATLGCPKCEPGVSILVRREWYGAVIMHAEGCPDPVEAEVQFAEPAEIARLTILDGQERIH
jgi:hypothetical protein